MFELSLFLLCRRRLVKDETSLVSAILHEDFVLTHHSDEQFTATITTLRSELYSDMYRPVRLYRVLASVARYSHLLRCSLDFTELVCATSMEVVFNFTTGAEVLGLHQANGKTSQPSDTVL